MMRDLRTLIYLLNLELREECSRTLGWNPAGAASGCGEQQSKRTRSGAAAEADASSERAATAEAGATSLAQPDPRTRRRLLSLECNIPLGLQPRG